MISTLGIIPPSPAELAERLATKMSLVRETLMSKGEYLPDPAMRERVKWVPSGSGHMLVVKSEDPPATDPSLSSVDSPASTPPNSATNAQLPTPETTPAPPPVPATLAMVVQIVPGQSWLHSDGKWTGPTQFIKQFSDIKLLCTGATPRHPQFTEDYSTSVASLKALMAEVRTTGYPTTSVLSGPDHNIRVRHGLFTVS